MGTLGIVPAMYVSKPQWAYLMGSTTNMGCMVVLKKGRWAPKI